MSNLKVKLARGSWEMMRGERRIVLSAETGAFEEEGRAVWEVELGDLEGWSCEMIERSKELDRLRISVPRPSSRYAPGVGIREKSSPSSLPPAILSSRTAFPSSPYLPSADKTPPAPNRVFQ